LIPWSVWFSIGQNVWFSLASLTPKREISRGSVSNSEGGGVKKVRI